MFIISFPSSGQNLMYRLLNKMYEYYSIHYSYCEFYTCCNSIPCKKNHFFQKNHDFKLNLNIDNDDKFVILYRNDKFEQLESYFRLDKRLNNSKINYNNINVCKEFIKFYNERSIYYDKFIKKYNQDNFKNAFIIEYNSFIIDYKEYIKRLIVYLDLPYKNLDEDVKNILDGFEKIERKTVICKRSIIEMLLKYKLIRQL
jgi:hypothetical protein